MRRTGIWLSILLVLFCFRVVGQMLVYFANVTWLPPMNEWYSGLMPYRFLLPAQFLIIGVYGTVCLQFIRGAGFFSQSRPAFANGVRYFGWVYLIGMLARYPLRMWLVPEARWFGQTIPIFFHWVLATFLLVFAYYHKRQLERPDS